MAVLNKPHIGYDGWLHVLACMCFFDAQRQHSQQQERGENGIGHGIVALCVASPPNTWCMHALATQVFFSSILHGFSFSFCAPSICVMMMLGCWLRWPSFAAFFKTEMQVWKKVLAWYARQLSGIFRPLLMIAQLWAKDFLSKILIYYPKVGRCGFFRQLGLFINWIFFNKDKNPTYFFMPHDWMCPGMALEYGLELWVVIYQPKWS